jgi:peptide/nickel transport system substrate-binding protein
MHCSTSRIHAVVRSVLPCSCPKITISKDTLIYLLLVFSLAACAPAPDNALRIGLASAPVTLDPRFSTDATSSRINRLIYARLVEFNEKQLPVPSLAKWEVISPLHYRFYLTEDDNKNNRTFHDGTHLTANDVKATYKTVLDPKTASPHRATLNMIDIIDVVDENTIDFHLSHPDLLFPAYLVIGILPEKYINNNYSFSRLPIGSGPFKFSSWPEDGKLFLKRLKDNQMVNFVRVKEDTVRVLKLIRGEIDMVQNDLSPELVSHLDKQENISVTHSRGSNFTYLGFNLDDAVVGQQNVRRAIALAIDRDAIIKYVMAGTARPASALLLPDHWAGNSELERLAYDPEKARALLAEAGFTNNKPLRLTYKTSTNAFRVRLATVLQSQLKKVGIEVDLRSYDWGTFYGDIKAGNIQMFSLSWVGIKKPDIFRYVFHIKSVPPNGANRGRYKDEKSDYLIKTAGDAISMEEQANSYRELQKRLLEKLPYVPLWYENHVFAVREDVTGYSLGLDGNYDGLSDVIKESVVNK